MSIPQARGPLLHLAPRDFSAEQELPTPLELQSLASDLRELEEATPYSIVVMLDRISRTGCQTGAIAHSN